LIIQGGAPVNRLRQVTPRKLGIAMFVVVVAVFGSLMGATFASGQAHAAHEAASSSRLPCHLGGDSCIHIGFTKAWLNGKTVDLEYSHNFFCRQPPSSGATSRCEVGAASQVDPTSGPVVSPLRTVVPSGFTPPKSTLQCPLAGHCIDHPHTIDLSRLFGSGATNVALPPHSHILIDDESFQSAWWPLVVVGVKNLRAWNMIVAAKSEAAVQACQAAGHCTPDIPTNGYLFFQVLGPGMSPQGPG
jgi:hypothetical protein